MTPLQRARTQDPDDSISAVRLVRLQIYKSSRVGILFGSSNAAAAAREGTRSLRMDALVSAMSSDETFLSGSFVCELAERQVRATEEE